MGATFIFLPIYRTKLIYTFMSAMPVDALSKGSALTFSIDILDLISLDLNL